MSMKRSPTSPKSHRSRFAAQWRVSWENDVERFYASIGFVSRVRPKSGRVATAADERAGAGVAVFPRPDPRRQTVAANAVAEPDEPCTVEATAAARQAAQNWCDGGVFTQVNVSTDANNFVVSLQFSQKADALGKTRSLRYSIAFVV